ncbi:MAG: hypothetical protein AAB638_02145 [Patescibacteria group bacterium]
MEILTNAQQIEGLGPVDIPMSTWGSKQRIIEAYKHLGHEVSVAAERLLLSGNMPLLDTEGVQQCFIATPHFLGFRSSVCRGRIYEVARTAGLVEVHPQAGIEFIFTRRVEVPSPWSDSGKTTILTHRISPPGEDIRMAMVGINYNGISTPVLGIFESRRQMLSQLGTRSNQASEFKVSLEIDAGDADVLFDVHSKWLFAVAS